MDAAGVEAALERFLSRRAGSAARIEGFRPLPGGTSREIYAFDLSGGENAGSRELILRMEPSEGRLEGERVDEFVLLAAVREAGVTVPGVHWLGTEEDGLGARFVIMDRVRGQAIARPLLRDEAYATARRALPQQLARELARIHAVDLGDPRLSSLVTRATGGGDPRRFALGEIRRYRDSLSACDDDHPRPALRFASRWLAEHAPAAATTGLVHGDFRIGNLMYDAQGLTAVIDWELAHVGDTREDLGWLAVRAWRFGHDQRAIGGLCDRETVWSAYEAESGRGLDRTAARWWEVFGNWKWAIICVMQAARHKAGRFANVELASLGRRTAEVEWEMVSLIERCDAGQA